MLAHQITIENKAATAQQHCLFGANQLADGAGLFDATLTGAQAVGQGRSVHMNGRGPARQARMLFGSATTRRQLPGFDAEDLVVEV
ncbi:hypothetical protein D3C73_1272700 [compost metagenome]